MYEHIDFWNVYRVVDFCVLQTQAQLSISIWKLVDGTRDFVLL